MSDPRNVAHEKKVKKEKEHHAPTSEEAKPKKGRADHAVPGSNRNDTAPSGQGADAEHSPGELEKSVAVLSKLKEMEFHSRANIETLAELTLAIDDELKQKDFVEPIGALYSAQDAFQTQVAALVVSYEAKCESLKPAA